MNANNVISIPTYQKPQADAFLNIAVVTESGPIKLGKRGIPLYLNKALDQAIIQAKLDFNAVYANWVNENEGKKKKSKEPIFKIELIGNVHVIEADSNHGKIKLK